MLKKFKLEDCKPVSAPMITGCKLCADDGSADIDQKLYRSMIGSLLYLIASRPDIMLAVGLVARYQAAPKQNHLLAVKEYSDIYKEQHNVDFGILKEKASL